MISCHTSSSRVLSLPRVSAVVYRKDLPARKIISTRVAIDRTRSYVVSAVSRGIFHGRNVANFRSRAIARDRRPLASVPAVRCDESALLHAELYDFIVRTEITVTNSAKTIRARLRKLKHTYAYAPVRDSSRVTRGKRANREKSAARRDDVLRHP